LFLPNKEQSLIYEQMSKFIIKYRSNKKKPKYAVLCCSNGGIFVNSTFDPAKATRFSGDQVPMFNHPEYNYELIEVEE